MVDNNSYKFLEGGGEMGNAIRAHDWATSPIGSVESWPVSLKITVGLLLSSPFPMYIAWGKGYTQIYNDGYRPILGSTKHPQALGISTRETFSEIWHIIGSMFDGVMEGTAVGFPNFMLPLNRNGYIEECYFDFSYSPIADENGNIGGVLVTVIEVTEKFNAIAELNNAKNDLEKANAESEKQRDRLKRFFTQAPAAICILDGEDLVLELVNPGYQQFFPGRDLIGLPLLDAIPEIRNQEIHEIIKGVYRNDKTFEGNQLKVPLARYNGGPIEERYFDFIYQPRHNSSGKVDGILVFAYEVTETVKVKLALEESESRFRSMVELSPVPMLVTMGPNLVFEEINPPMLEMLGKDISVRGKSVFEVLPELQGQPIMDKLFKTLKEGEAWTGLEQPILVNRSGKELQGYYNITYKPLFADGKIAGVLQSAVDVTEQVNARKELERAEDTLRLSLLSGKIGTFDMDLEKETMDWDDRCRELFGIAHHNPVSYEQDFVNGLHPDDRERILEIISGSVMVKRISNGDYNVEYRTVGAEDQKIRWVRAMGKAYFNKKDLPVRFMGTVFDITELKEDELRKNDFIGMVSHELKTPLTSLKAYLELCQLESKVANNERSTMLLEKADKQLVKMNDLINGFLNISRLESGKIHLHKEHFNIDKVAEEVLTEAKTIFKSHTFIFKPCDPLPVSGDKDKIASVISNLLNNASKYSPNETEIIVECSAVGGNAMIAVRDFGVGIRKEDASRLFERYYRVDAPENKRISGFGIGLYLSAEIIHRHGGEIGVDSEPGVGSLFYFKLPLET